MSFQTFLLYTIYLLSNSEKSRRMVESHSLCMDIQGYAPFGKARPLSLSHNIESIFSDVNGACFEHFTTELSKSFGQLTQN